VTQISPVSKDVDEALRKFTDKTPAMLMIKGGKPTTAAGKGDKGEKKGGKKKGKK
jgi:hypothetical protein